MSAFVQNVLFAGKLRQSEGERAKSKYVPRIVYKQAPGEFTRWQCCKASVSRLT